MSDSLRPMTCSTPGFPVHHQLPELAQPHVHGVSDAIQPSHPLSFPSPPASNLWRVFSACLRPLLLGTVAVVRTLVVCGRNTDAIRDQRKQWRVYQDDLKGEVQA